MNASEKSHELLNRLHARGIERATFQHAQTLRRASMTLQRWYEGECGDGNSAASWAIERDEKTGKPYKCVYPHNETGCRKYPINDRESGAIRRVQAVCKEVGCYAFFQSDPRGCPLWVSSEPLSAETYTSGVAC